MLQPPLSGDVLCWSSCMIFFSLFTCYDYHNNNVSGCLTLFTITHGQCQCFLSTPKLENPLLIYTPNPLATLSKVQIKKAMIYVD